jgi:hypothetical protein
MNSKTASKAEKSVAASALTQKTSAKNTTSKAVAVAAAKILRDPKASKAAKSAAASALTQKPKFKAKNVNSDDVYRAVNSYLSKREA